MTAAQPTAQASPAGGAPADTLDEAWARANALVEAADYSAALALYRQMVEQAPELPQPWLNMGIVHFWLEQPDEARRCLETAADLDPFNAAARLHLGSVLLAQQHPDEAAEQFRNAVEIDPDLAPGWSRLGIALRALGQADEAVSALERAHALDPGDVDSSFRLGNLYSQLGRGEDAVRLLEAARAVNPDPAIINNLANELSQLDRNNEAEALLRDCLAAHPEHALAWNTLGAILMAESRYGEASEAFEQAAWLQPGLIAARQNLARCHVQMHDLSGAVRIFRALLDDCPDNPLIYSDCALVLLELGDLAQAERVQRRALAIDPGCKAGWSNLAIIFERTGRWADCLDAAQHAIALEPGDPIPHVSAALASHKLYRPAEAEAEARRALETGGDNPGVLHSIGRLYEGMKRADLALELYRQAQAVEPGHMMSKARLFDLALSICDWSDYETMARQQVEHLKAELAKPGSQLNIDVFNLQALPISYELVGRAARKAARQIAAEARQFWSGGGFAHVRRRRKRIRLGYALAYTWYHSLPLVLRGVIAAHDRERFEVFGYSIRTSDGSDFCREYRGAFDRFRDVPGASPQDAAAQIREDGIDVLIDTTGLTSITCLPLCSLRPAPVQVHGFGYSITTGADYIDYLVTDRTYIPPEWEKVGTEKLIYLPDSFMPAVRLEEDLPARSRAEHGLPEDAVVFCNFNHPCKFEPESFAAWMRVLRQVPGSVLWLGGWLDETRGNLRREAGRHGVDPERLLFADIATHPEHMARLALADLGLDNLRHGGGVTTLDALWAGVPVLTVTGNTPAARLGATLVGAAGMPELALPDLAAYEARAVALARDRAALETVQRKLREQRDRCALFNIPGYTRHLEAGLTAAWETWLAGESPRRIDVATLT